MLKRILATATVAGAGLALWGGLVERNRFTLREHTLPVLPTGHKPVRILQLSDLHMTPWQLRKQEWVSSLAALRPDFVIGTGDFLGHERGVDGVALALAAYRGIPGAFVNGSNDYFAPRLKNPLQYLFGPSKYPTDPKRLDISQLLDVYDGLGWIDLNNHAGLVELNGTRFGLMGVDDAHKEFDDLDAVADATDELESVDVLLGVTHAPYRRVLDAFTARGAAVIFAGHTHGGQVCLPERLGGTLVTNCDIPRDQARGLSIWHIGTDAAALNVSAGVGTSMYAPIRLFCPPEATLITLIAAE